MVVSDFFGNPPGIVRDGRHVITMRVCRECAAQAGFPVAVVLPGFDCLAITQPED